MAALPTQLKNKASGLSVVQGVHPVRPWEAIMAAALRQRENRGSGFSVGQGGHPVRPLKAMTAAPPKTRGLGFRL